MRIRILLILLLCCLSGTSFASDSASFSLYLVRHAEKDTDGGRDPALTKAGQQRAILLAAWLKGKDITDIWSSGYRRTIDTAQPLAPELGLLLNIYDPRDQEDLVGRLLARQDNTLVVGHSNTIPELARLLCECAIADMEEMEYDRLIVISIDGKEVQVRTLNQGELFKSQNR